MSAIRHKPTGFTIVELLIVIVVIGILAAITVVAYNGVQTRARLTTLQSDVRNARPQLELIKTETGSYPADASTLKKSDGTMFTYSKVNDGYCVSATNSSADIGSFHTYNTGSVELGPCPIAQWTFNGNADDSSPYENNGTVIGATLTADRNGNANSAYSFNGGSQITCGSDISLEPSAVSVSAWVYPTAYSSSLHGIINNGTGGYWLHLNGDGTPVFYISDSSIAGSSPLSLNQWHYVAGTYTSGARNLYVDGRLVASDAKTGTIINYSSSYPCRIGNVKNISDRYFVGSLDDIRVYDRALTTVELKQLYEAN